MSKIVLFATALCMTKNERTLYVTKILDEYTGPIGSTPHFIFGKQTIAGLKKSIITNVVIDFRKLDSSNVLMSIEVDELEEESNTEKALDFINYIRTEVWKINKRSSASFYVIGKKVETKNCKVIEELKNSVVFQYG